jgi:hypothetical protein
MSEEEMIKKFEELFMRNGAIHADLVGRDPERFQWYVEQLGIIDAIKAGTNGMVTGMEVITIREEEPDFSWLDKY